MIFTEIGKLFRKSSKDKLPDWGKKEFYEELSDIRDLWESVTLGAHAELSKDNKGWLALDTSTTGLISEKMRRDIVTTSREWSLRDGLVKQGMALYTNYGVGTGLVFQAEDKAAQVILEEFWGSKRNRKFTSTKGQQALSNSIQTDGELPLMLFRIKITGGKTSTLRKLDPLEIVDIATDPDDKFQERFYIRKFIKGRGPKLKQETRIYADWTNEKPFRPGEPSVGKLITQPTTGLPSVYFAKLQEGYLRGYSLFSAMLHWAKVHRQFMRSRATVTQAIAALAYKLKVKGGTAAVNAMKNALQSGLVNTDTENNPVEAPGATWIENAAANLSQLKQETGAQAAQVDGNMLLTMAGAAIGVFPHYFGAGEAFRLATATAMEGPMRKAFESYSQIWLDIWHDIFNIVLENAGIPENKRSVEMVYPEILVKDLLTSMQAIDQLVKTFPDMVASKIIQKKALGLMGFSLPQHILDDIPDIKRERPEQFGLPPFGGAGTKPPTPQESMRMIHKMLVSQFKESNNENNMD